MAKSPKETEEKMERILNAWRTLAPDKSFGGMTLAQFENVAKPVRDTRSRIDELEELRNQAIAAREDADADFEAKAQLVINGVLADPTEGSDSPLYEGMGYTRKSERKSGLTRKPKSTTTK